MLESYKVQIQQVIAAAQDARNISELEETVAGETEIGKKPAITNTILDFSYSSMSTPFPLYELEPADTSYIMKANYHTEEEYKGAMQQEQVEEGEAQAMDNQEAYETMEDVTFAIIMGDKYSVDYQARQRLSTWIQFNPVEFALKQMDMLSRDVDYSA